MKPDTLRKALVFMPRLADVILALSLAALILAHVSFVPSLRSGVEVLLVLALLMIGITSALLQGAIMAAGWPSWGQFLNSLPRMAKVAYISASVTVLVCTTLLYFQPMPEANPAFGSVPEGFDVPIHCASVTDYELKNPTCQAFIRRKELWVATLGNSRDILCHECPGGFAVRRAGQRPVAPSYQERFKRADPEF